MLSNVIQSRKSQIIIRNLKICSLDFKKHIFSVLSTYRTPGRMNQKWLVLLAFKNTQPDSVTAVSSRRPQQTFRRTTLSSYHFPGPLSLSPDVLVPPGLFDPPLLPPLFLKIRQLVWMPHEKSCEKISRCILKSQKNVFIV